MPDESFSDWSKERRRSLRNAPANVGIDAASLKARSKDAHSLIDEMRVYQVASAPGSPDWLATKTIIQEAEVEIATCNNLASHFGFDL